MTLLPHLSLGKDALSIDKEMGKHSRRTSLDCRRSLPRQLGSFLNAMFPIKGLPVQLPI